MAKDETGRAPRPRGLLSRLGLGRPARPERGYCYLGGGRAIALTHAGKKIYLDTRDLGLTPHIATEGIWEPDVEAVLKRLVRPGHRVAEVGANMGYHTLTLAEGVGPRGHVDSFEANPAVLPLLRATIAVNGITDRVTIHPEAALDAAGTVEFTSDPDHIGSGHLAIPGEAAHYSRLAVVPAVTLDAALAALARLDVLRMDAEGSEPLVLRGATALLQRSPGVAVVTEWSAPMMARHDLGGLVGWLGDMGFRYWRIETGGRLAPVPGADLSGLSHADLVLSRVEPPT